MSRRLIAMLLSVALLVSVLAIPGPGGVQKAYALTNQWYPSGPYGGNIVGFASQGTAVYTADSYGVFKSADDGVTWQAVTKPPGLRPTAIAADASAVYAGTSDGYISRTVDGGTTWTQIGAPAGGVQVNRLVPSGTALYAATDNGLYKTTDGGATWTALKAGDVIEAMLNTDGALYIIVSSLSGKSVLKSTDGGATWIDISQAGFQPSRLAHTADGTIYADGPYRYRTTDGVWVYLAPTTGVYGSVLDGLGNTLYVGNDGLQFSSDGGNTWSAPNATQFYYGIGAKVTAVAQGTSSLLIGTNMGVYRSLDGGATATFSSQGIKWGVSWSGMEMTAASATELFVGAAKGVYRSLDGGNTWSPIFQTTDSVQTMTLTADGALLIATGPSEHRLVKINKDGTGYQEIDHVNAPLDLAKAPDGTLYAAAYAGNYVSKSADNGLTWQAINTGLGVVPRRLFAASDGSVYAWYSGVAGLYRLPPGGTTWASLAAMNTAVYDIVQTAAGLYALTPGSVYRSDDGGLTWAVVPIGGNVPSGYDQMEADSQGSLYIAGGGSVLKSVDGGQSWFNFSTGLPQGTTTTSLYMAPGDRAFLKTSDGVYDPPIGPDNQPPSGSVTINNGAQLTTNPALSLQITATDNTGVTDMLISDTPSFTGANWQAYSPTASFTLTGLGGNRTVYVRLRDGNGNTADVFDTIAYDKDPPSGALQINNGASTTTNSNATLNITSSDDVLVTDMIASEDPTFLGATWEPVASTKSFSLSPGTGAKTVYLKVRDMAGRESSAASAAITVQSGGGTAALVSPSNGAQRDPNVTGGKLVYRSTHDTGSYEIYRLDPATGAVERLTTGDNASGLKARGNLAAWEGGTSTVQVLNLSAGVLADTGHAGTEPNTDGQFVVWIENGEVMLYDGQSGAVTQITSTPQFEAAPAVGSGHVVWDDAGAIWAYNISTGTASKIYSNPTAATVKELKVRGNTVYWADYRTATWKVYAHTLGQPMDSEQAVGGVNEATLNSFDVDNALKRLVWSNGSAVYSVDLTTGTTTTVATGTAWQTVTDDNLIAWRVDLDIYYLVLAPPAPPPPPEPFVPSVNLSTNIAGATGAEYSFSFAPTQDYAAGANPNRVVLTLPGQSLAGVSPATIWTAGAPGVQTPVVDTVQNTVTIPFAGTMDKHAPVTVAVTNVSNQSAAGTANLSVTIQRWDSGSASYVAADTAQVSVSYVQTDGTVTGVVGRAMEVQLTGAKRHTYTVDPATSRTAEGSVTVSVKSNADAVAVTLKSDGDLRDAAGAVMGFQSTADAPGMWADAQAGFGYTVIGGDPKWQSGTAFAALRAIGDAILSVSQPTGDSARQVTVKFRARGGMGTKPGTYANAVTFVVTPTYGN